MSESSTTQSQAINSHCPWSGEAVDPNAITQYKGHWVGFCNMGCKEKFEKAVICFDDAIVQKDL